MNTPNAPARRHRKLFLRDSAPPTSVPPRPPYYFAGGETRNPYIVLAVTCFSWVAVIGLVICMAVNPPTVRDSMPIRFMISAVCLAVVGYQSASRRAWPAAFLLWILAVGAVVTFFRG